MEVKGTLLLFMRLWHFVCLITFHQFYGWFAAFFLFGLNIQKVGQQVRMRMKKLKLKVQRINLNLKIKPLKNKENI